MALGLSWVQFEKQKSPARSHRVRRTRCNARVGGQTGRWVDQLISVFAPCWAYINLRIKLASIHMLQRTGATRWAKCINRSSPRNRFYSVEAILNNWNVIIEHDNIRNSCDAFSSLRNPSFWFCRYWKTQLYASDKWHGLWTMPVDSEAFCMPAFDILPRYCVFLRFQERLYAQCCKRYS